MAQQTTAYWQQQVNYKIQVNLNDTTHILDGFEEIEYTNNSPDSLHFLWVHIWPNAYKNDKTAYAEQIIAGGRNLRFYFSDNDEKGYVNRLDFKSNGISLGTDDHPQYIDAIKVILSKPLAPSESVTIQTPFHVKLPYLFSRMGHADQSYVIAQWYPKVAVYDKFGWHVMPYLEWGEYYNDFGNYDVKITLPENYVVAATGELQENSEKEWMKTRTEPIEIVRKKGEKKELFTRISTNATRFPPSSKKWKTISYHAENVIDFAWMADKRFLVKYDTIQLTKNIAEVWNLTLPQYAGSWAESMQYTKRAIRFYGSQLGEYPYPQVSVVCDPVAEFDGMEYPMISTLNAAIPDKQNLAILIAHEVGHNWLQAILASNERNHAWMDEGMNTFYERKYLKLYYPEGLHSPKRPFGRKLPLDDYQSIFNSALSNRSDQPIETRSDKFASSNYTAAAYYKAGLWMEKLEAQIGVEVFRKLMQAYFAQWQFKHPYPLDFRTLAESSTNQNMAADFRLLSKTGSLSGNVKRPTRITTFFNLQNTDNASYIGIMPALGFNNYDKLEIGLMAHNYNNPSKPFQFVLAPMFATGTKQLVGLGRASYNWYPETKLKKIQLYATIERFNFDDAGELKNKDGNDIYRAFTKFAPGIYFEWKSKTPLTALRKWIDFRTFIISEQQLTYFNFPAPADTTFYAARKSAETTISPQLRLGFANEGVLYPWSVELTMQQVKQVLRNSISAKYFLNYNEKNQGLSCRLFFGKIFYTKAKTLQLRSQHYRYHFFMYGPNVDQDFTYQNMFAERNANTGILGRQVLIRDGGFKYRTDYGGGTPGLSAEEKNYFFDDWLASANFTLDVPDKINPLSKLPVNIPLKIFADFGTSAAPWKTGSTQPRFLYSVGLQLSFFKFIQFYYPFVQSSAFKEPTSFNAAGNAANWWQKRLTFSIDVNELKQKAKRMFVL